MTFLEIEHRDLRAQHREHVEQRGTRRVQADRIEYQVGAGKNGGGAEEERGRRDVAGNRGFNRMERLRAGDGDGIGSAGKFGAKGSQRQFAVIAGADSFAHRRGALGLQAGEQDAGFHLRAGNRSRVVDALQRSAFEMQRRVALGKREPRAHGFKRLANPLHWPARKGIVTGEREAARLRGQQAGEHAHG